MNIPLFYAKGSKNRIQLALFILIIVLTLGNIIFAFLTSGVWQEEMSSRWGILVFTGIVAISYIAAQYILNAFLKDTSSGIFKRKIKFFRLLEVLLRFSQYVIGALLLALILQTLFTSEYYAVIPIAILVISFASAAITSSILTYKLLSWFRQNDTKRGNSNLVMLLFGLSTAALSLGLAATLTINSAALLAENPIKVTSHEVQDTFEGIKDKASSQTSLQGDHDSSTVILLRNTFLPFRISFILIWIGSTILLYPYSKSIGKITYWIVISLPVASNLIAYIHASLGPSYLLSDRLVLVLSSTAGGILVSIIFLIMARNISKDSKKSQNEIVNYLNASAYGTAILVISLLSPAQFMPYPPIGVASWSLVGLATFILSIGIYSSAVSVSEDNSLRSMIRRNVIAESKLLGSIGTAQMVQDMQKRVLKIAREQEESMKEETGIQASLSEDDMRQYLDRVMDEIRKVPSRDSP